MSNEVLHDEAAHQEQLLVLLERAEKAEAALIDLLRAPFMEWYPYAIGIACNLVDHPDRYPHGRRPKFKSDQCPCGKRREDREEFMDARTTR